MVDVVPILSFASRSLARPTLQHSCTLIISMLVAMEYASHDLFVFQSFIHSCADHISGPAYCMTPPSLDRILLFMRSLWSPSTITLFVSPL
jgi:hypothetical protein